VPSVSRHVRLHEAAQLTAFGLSRFINTRAISVLKMCFQHSRLLSTLDFFTACATHWL